MDRLRLQNVERPLPASIWRKVAQDKFVDFEKLFAAMESGFRHDDEAKDFGAGYVIVKKDQFNAQKKLTSQADWLHVFDAWRAGVVVLFPHRAAELARYRVTMSNTFRRCKLDISVGQRRPASPRVVRVATVSSG